MKSWRSLIGWPLSTRRNRARETISTNPTRADRSARPLRLRLMFWITIWLAPVAAVSVIQGVDRVTRDIADVRERITEAARASASQEENVVASGEQVLRALANQPQVRDAGPGCSSALSDALRGLVFFTNLVRIDEHGSIVCAAASQTPREKTVATEDWWSRT